MGEQIGGVLQDGTGLAGVPADAGLVGVLAGVDPARLSPDAQVDALVGWERVLAWAAAQQQRVLAAMPVDCDTRLGTDYTVHEVALALNCSTAAAETRLTVARELCGRLADTHAALAAGVIGYWQAKVITEAVLGLDDGPATAVQARVLARVRARDGLSMPELRRELRRALLSVDPAVAERRRAAALADRAVTSRAFDDGLGLLCCTGAVDRIATARDILDRLAGALPVTDPRGMDARRSDLLLDLIHDAADRDPTGLRPGPAPCLHLTLTLPALLGLDDRPGELTGWGPITAPAARALAALGGWTARLGSTGADRLAWTSPDQADLSTASDGAAAAVPAQAPSEVSTRGPGQALDTAGGWAEVPVANLAWTGTLTPSGQVRGALSWTGSGTITDTGPRRYQPSPALARFIRGRDRTCQWPRCNQPARRCDLDHAQPYDLGGPTSSANNHCLCRKHHRAKTHGGYQVRRHPDGSATWTTPSGKTYRAPPPEPLPEE